MGGKSSRAKGQAGEREIADMLTYATGIHVTRNLTQTRGGGDDINCIPGISVEVKRQEALSVNSWWKQCIRQAEERVPVLAYRQNRKPWIFIVGERENSMNKAEFVKWLKVHMAKVDSVQVNNTLWQF